VLDTAHGRLAEGIEVTVSQVDGMGVVAHGYTNIEGTTEQPLLEGPQVALGPYELTYGVGSYFARHPVDADLAPYFDVITVRILVSDGMGPVHIGLLVSPWSYTTYRGRNLR
jgi:2-oxo-4-hydroxy-4-carboxy-5-ureidoimidazoline decarboxylase